MSFVASIRLLRSNAGLSQQAVADAVGLARATYIKLENGGREPKLGELTKISQYYEVGLQDLVSGTVMAGGIYNQPIDTFDLPGSMMLQVQEAPAGYYNDAYKPDDAKTIQDQRDHSVVVSRRDAVPQLQPSKLRQVLLYVVSQVGARPHVGEAVLFKLLYFIDLDYYEQTGQSVTGLSYIHDAYGPVPATALQAVLDDMQACDELEIVETKHFSHKQKKYLPLREASLSQLSAPEIKHIDAELERLAGRSAAELRSLAYKDAPWVIAKQGQSIDYRDTFYRTDATSVVELDDDL